MAPAQTACPAAQGSLSKETNLAHQTREDGAWDMPRNGMLALLFVAALSLAAERVATAQALKLVSPRGGEQWLADSLHWIVWTSGPEVNAVRIGFTTDGGQRWQPVAEAGTGTLATSVASSSDTDNRLLWRVPPVVGKDYRIQIVGMGGRAMQKDLSGSFAVGPSGQADYQWQCITLQADFAGRDGAGALTFKDRMWLLGGWNPTDKVNFPQICNSEVWCSADGATWTEANPQAPWEGRHTAGYAVHQARMWIIGGDANQRHYQSDVWNSADGVNWELVTDRVPWHPRVLHYTVAFKGKLWIMGGQTLPQFGGGEEIFYSDVWNSENGRDWTKVADHCPWGPRGMIGGAAVFQDRIWILGGGTYDTPTIPTREFYNDVWSSTDGVHWEQVLAAAPWHPRQYHDVAVWDGKLWVMEGYHADGGNRNDVWYSSDGVNWYELPNTPWAPRHAASLFVHNDALWMVAGNNMFPDVWKLVRK